MEQNEITLDELRQAAYKRLLDAVEKGDDPDALNAVKIILDLREEKFSGKVSRRKQPQRRDDVE